MISNFWDMVNITDIAVKTGVFFCVNVIILTSLGVETLNKFPILSSYISFITLVGMLIHKYSVWSRSPTPDTLNPYAIPPANAANMVFIPLQQWNSNSHQKKMHPTTVPSTTVSFSHPVSPNQVINPDHSKCHQHSQQNDHVHSTVPPAPTQHVPSKSTVHPAQTQHTPSSTKSTKSPAPSPVAPPTNGFDFNNIASLFGQGMKFMADPDVRKGIKDGISFMKKEFMGEEPQPKKYSRQDKSDNKGNKKEPSSQPKTEVSTTTRNVLSRYILCQCVMCVTIKNNVGTSSSGVSYVASSETSLLGKIFDCSCGVCKVVADDIRKRRSAKKSESQKEFAKRTSKEAYETINGPGSYGSKTKTSSSKSETQEEFANHVSKEAYETINGPGSYGSKTKTSSSKSAIDEWIEKNNAKLAADLIELEKKQEDFIFSATKDAYETIHGKDTYDSLSEDEKERRVNVTRKRFNFKKRPMPGGIQLQDMDDKTKAKLCERIDEEIKNSTQDESDESDESEKETPKSQEVPSIGEMLEIGQVALQQVNNIMSSGTNPLQMLSQMAPLASSMMSTLNTKQEKKFETDTD